VAAWTTADDVIDAWIGDDAPTDANKVGIWIDKAEREVRVQVPTITDRITADTTGDLLANTKDVVIAMVQRVFRNPEGVRQVSEGTGPFSGSKTYGGNHPGALYLTDEELSKLSPAGQNSGAFTVDSIPVSSPFSDNYTAPTNGWGW
jgi:hypothetical protein